MLCFATERPDVMCCVQNGLPSSAALRKLVCFCLPPSSSKPLTASAFYSVKLVFNIFLFLSLPPLLTSLLFHFPSCPAHFADNSGECDLVRALSSVGSLVKSIRIVGDLIILID